MPTIPEYVTVQCPDCFDDIRCELDVAPMPGTDGAKLIAWAPDLAGPLVQHYRDAGHISDTEDVAVKVHTLHLN
jgi:hypothetical protein